MRDILDFLDSVETQIEINQVCQVFQSLNVSNAVIVQFKILQEHALVKALYLLDEIFSETQRNQFGATFEPF